MKKIFDKQQKLEQNTSITLIIILEWASEAIKEGYTVKSLWISFFHDAKEL